MNNSISVYGNKIYNNLKKSFRHHVDKSIQNDCFAAKFLICTNVAKDIYAYGCRFKESKNNKEIPEEKRNLVAALDLVSGGVTAIVQILVGFAIANPKLQDKISNKLFQNVSQEIQPIVKKSFIALTSLIGSGIIAERIIVPLISTPLAESLKTKINSINNDNTRKIDKF